MGMIRADFKRLCANEQIIDNYRCQSNLRLFKIFIRFDETASDRPSINLNKTNYCPRVIIHNVIVCRNEYVCNYALYV